LCSLTKAADSFKKGFSEVKGSLYQLSLYEECLGTNAKSILCEVRPVMQACEPAGLLTQNDVCDT